MIHDIVHPVLAVNTGRKLSKAVAAIEALQVIAEESRPRLLIRAAPAFENYAEYEFDTQIPHFHGAYGRRIRGQLDQALSKLRGDPDTRRAVITIWDPMLDNQHDHQDYPCTVALQFELVHDRLEMHTLMRSNDCWTGLPYDVFLWSQLQWTVAHLLDVAPGRYTHTAWSLHLYERDLEKVDGVDSPDVLDYSQPSGLACDSIGTARRTASRLLAGDKFETYLSGHLAAEHAEGESHVESLRWYIDALVPAVESSGD